MIISQTPTRLSLLGGGTDYPAHFKRYGGQTLGVAMNQYTYVTVKPIERLFEYRIKVNYSTVETTEVLDDLQHPSIRECMRYAGVPTDIEISSLSDLPARTGIGSSSSFSVGLLNALNTLKGVSSTPRELAESAVHVEQTMIGERVGIQDQFTAAFGGLVHLIIDKSGKVDVHRVDVSQEHLENLSNRVMLFYTKIRRRASDTLKEQSVKTESGELDSHLKKMSDFVAGGITALTHTESFADLGELIYESWNLKKKLSTQVSTPTINEWIDAAMNAGASGGKLMGAGAGGFLMLLVEPEKQTDVANALADLPLVRPKFDFTGSQIVFPAL